MSDSGGLPELGALIDGDEGVNGDLIVVSEHLRPLSQKHTNYESHLEEQEEQQQASAPKKRQRSPVAHANHHNIKCTLEHAQHLLDLVDKRADAADEVAERKAKMNEAKNKRTEIERDMYRAALALAPAIVASGCVHLSDVDKAVFQAVTNVYRTDRDNYGDDDEDSEDEEYRKSKITIVFWGNETTHNAPGSGPQQPGKKTLYVHIIKGEFVRACFSQGEVVYAWIKTGLGDTGVWEGPALPKHAPILTDIARLHGRLVWFAGAVLQFMRMNDNAWHGKSDQTRVFWRDHIIPRLQAVERAHDLGFGHDAEEEQEEDEEQEEEPPKRSKSGRKPKNVAPPPPQADKKAAPKKAAGRGGGGRRKK